MTARTLIHSATNTVTLRICCCSVGICRMSHGIELSYRFITRNHSTYCTCHKNILIQHSDCLNTETYCVIILEHASTRRCAISGTNDVEHWTTKRGGEVHLILTLEQSTKTSILYMKQTKTERPH